jgi:hypothetical protein
MTKEELELAQFLKGIHVASELADKLDPERKHGQLKPYRRAFVVSCLDSIAVDGRQAFFQLTGRFPEGVYVTELNVERPAEWTRDAPGLRGDA